MEKTINPFVDEIAKAESLLGNNKRPAKVRRKKASDVCVPIMPYSTFPAWLTSSEKCKPKPLKVTPGMRYPYIAPPRG